MLRRGMKLSGRSGVVACLLLAASPALAADVDFKVSEVLLANNGVATAQYIELENPTPGAFDGGYVLQVFGADGTTQAGFQNVIFGAATTRIVFSTANAKAAFGDLASSATLTITNLSIALPAAGTACFKKSGVFHHCLSWGTVTFPADAGALASKDAGPAPADSMSLQRVTGCAAVGAPTYATANAATCPVAGDMTVVPDSGVPSDGATGTPDGGGSGSNNTSDDDDGCSVGGGAGWLGLVGLAGAAVLVRRRRRQ